MTQTAQSKKKRKYAFITNSIDLESPQPILKKLKSDAMEAIRNDLVVLPSGEFKFLDDFELALKNAKALHDFLDENNNLLESNRIINIPSLFLSPNPLHGEGFPKNEQTDPVLMEIQVTEGMKKVILELQGSKKIELSLQGTRGLGKSYLLALYTLVSRQDAQKRVFYVNNPEECRRTFSLYLANEFIYSFFRDHESKDFPLPPQKSPGKTRLEMWYQYLSGTTNAEEISNAFQQLLNFYEKKGIRVIFMLDQMDIVSQCSQSYQDKDFSDKFSTIFQIQNCSSKIISETESNENSYFQKNDNKVEKLFDGSDIIQRLYGLLKEKTGPIIAAKIHGKEADLECNENGEIAKNKFEESPKKQINFIVGQTLNFPFIQDPENSMNWEIIPNWKKMKEFNSVCSIIEAIGDSPLELSKFVEYVTLTNVDDLKSLIEKYLNERAQEYYYLHKKYRFAKNYSKKELIEIFKVFDALKTDQSCEQLLRHDPNLIYAMQVESGFRYYPVCPAAEKALKQYYTTDFSYNKYQRGEFGGEEEE